MNNFLMSEMGDYKLNDESFLYDIHMNLKYRANIYKPCESQPVLSYSRVTVLDFVIVHTNKKK